jgi:hypothetical protein
MLDTTIEFTHLNIRCYVFFEGHKTVKEEGKMKKVKILKGLLMFLLVFGFSSYVFAKGTVPLKNSPTQKMPVNGVKSAQAFNPRVDYKEVQKIIKPSPVHKRYKKLDTFSKPFYAVMQDKTGTKYAIKYSASNKREFTATISPGKGSKEKACRYTLDLKTYNLYVYQKGSIKTVYPGVYTKDNNYDMHYHYMKAVAEKTMASMKNGKILTGKKQDFARTVRKLNRLKKRIDAEFSSTKRLDTFGKPFYSTVQDKKGTKYTVGYSASNERYFNVTISPGKGSKEKACRYTLDLNTYTLYVYYDGFSTTVYPGVYAKHNNYDMHYHYMMAAVDKARKNARKGKLITGKRGDFAMSFRKLRRLKKRIDEAFPYDIS